MEDVTDLYKKTDNALMCSPEQALNEALSNIGKSGTFKNGKKILIICLDDTDKDYAISWIQAGMQMSECLTLCELAKTLFKRAMDY